MKTTAIRAVTGIAAGAALVGGLLLALSPARADKIKNPTAVFNGLDKITGRIIAFDVAVDETVQFGALQITPRVCYSRPPTETPLTDAFIEVDEVTLENKYRRIFSGWMFAASPGLHGVEHAVYDVWLTECKGGTAVIAETKEKDDAPAAAAASRPTRQQRQAKRTNSAGQIDVEAPRGREVAPRQASRRYFPTNEGGAPGAPGGMNPGFNPGR